MDLNTNDDHTFRKNVISQIDLIKDKIQEDDWKFTLTESKKLVDILEFLS